MSAERPTLADLPAGSTVVPGPREGTLLVPAAGTKGTAPCDAESRGTAAHEAEMVRSIVGSQYAIVTPGIRPAGSAVGDQKRVTGPAAALTSTNLPPPTFARSWLVCSYVRPSSGCSSTCG